MSDLFGNVLAKFPRDKIVIIDTETTGLDPENNEVLALAAVDVDGNELFYHLIHPHTRKRWPKAQEIHGIKWADVKNEKLLTDYADELAPLFAADNLIVGYNVWFDIEMIRASNGIIPANNTFDVMEEFARANTADGHWTKLEKAAEYYGYKFSAHNALDDAKATAYVFNKLMESQKYIDICDNERKQREEFAKQVAKDQKRQATAEKVQRMSSNGVKIAGLLFIIVVIAVFFTMCSSMCTGQ